MIHVVLIGHSFHFPVSDVLRLFFGQTGQISDAEITAPYPEELSVLSILTPEGKVETREKSGRYCAIPSAAYLLPPNREVKRQLYQLLSELTGRTYPWGSLTGIRPTLIARESPDISGMVEIYGVRPDKAELAFGTAKAEDMILSHIPADSKAIYIGIPFCPGRCSYCSFVSENHSDDMESVLSEYADAIIKEICALRSVLNNISSVYVGGGTPTVMNDELFPRFIRECFSELNLPPHTEITVEAGRPDTVTKAKLLALRDAGISRICINPQTLSDKTLSVIGRNHTSEQFMEAFRLARAAGFSSINTDLIAGLPGEGPDDFRHTLDTIVSLHPENITIHTLSRKRASRMSTEHIFVSDEPAVRFVDEMLRYASGLLTEKGYRPYYLYRQKDTVGGHENTGYSIPGKECSYNVAMMSDERSVIAVGAGGISKKVMRNGHLERCPCVKNPREYMKRLEETAARKLAFFENDDPR